jgi:hypothetical protein
MKAVTLPAHFDGKHIQLDEPFKLATDARLMVTVLTDTVDHERADWLALSKAGLARTYADDEPGYPASLVRKRRKP